MTNKTSRELLIDVAIDMGIVKSKCTHMESHLKDMNGSIKKHTIKLARMEDIPEKVKDLEKDTKKINLKLAKFGGAVVALVAIIQLIF